MDSTHNSGTELSDYPLCKAAGLDVQLWNAIGGWLSAKDVEAYLQKQMMNKEDPPKFNDWEFIRSVERNAKWIEWLKKDPQFIAKDLSAPKGDDPMPKMSDGFFKPEDAMGTIVCVDVDLLKKGRGSEAAKAAFPAITIDAANRLLQERGTVVYGGRDGETPNWWYIDNTELLNYSKPTHQALLINIQPIEKEDSAEGLLRELLAKPLHPFDDEKWLVRAKKLLSLHDAYAKDPDGT